MRHALVLVLFTTLTTLGCYSGSDHPLPQDDDTDVGDDDDAGDDDTAPTGCEHAVGLEGCDFLVPETCPTIQEAIHSAVDGETVCVSPGLYVETLEMIAKDVALVGLEGSENTTIDADDMGPVMQFIQANGPEAALHGFTLRNGYSEIGGGIYLEDSNPSLYDVKVTSCHAWTDGGGLYAARSSPTLAQMEFHGNWAWLEGGGLYLYESSPLLADVTLEGNQAQDGGGIFMTRSSPTLQDVLLVDNSADDDAGALYVTLSSPTLTRVEITGTHTQDRGSTFWDESPAVLTDVTLTANTATYGGGMSIQGMESPTFRDVVITGNVATQAGGGLHLDSANVTIENVRIEGNTAFWGGGLSIHSVLDNPGVILRNTRLVANQAYESGGALYLCSSSSARLENVLILDNVSPLGGGFTLEISTSLMAVNTVIAANVANNHGGAGQLLPDSTFGGTNTLVWGNLAQQGGGLYGDNAQSDLSHCDVHANDPDDFHGLDDPTGTEGNVSVAPAFLDTTSASPADWDLHLAANSPLIDAGSDESVDPDGSPADIGAFGGPAASTWDLDSDEYPSWWSPGPYDSGSYPDEGWDCDDLDADVHPGSGC